MRTDSYFNPSRHKMILHYCATFLSESLALVHRYWLAFVVSVEKGLWIKCPWTQNYYLLLHQHKAWKKGILLTFKMYLNSCEFSPSFRALNVILMDSRQNSSPFSNIFQNAPTYSGYAFLQSSHFLQHTQAHGAFLMVRLKGKHLEPIDLRNISQGRSQTWEYLHS